MKKLPHNNKTIVFFLALAIIIASFTAAFIAVRLNFTSNKVSDTSIRTKLLALKNNQLSQSSFEPQDSVLYSGLIYDFEINKDFSGPLPWSEYVAASPAGIFSFQWRVKLSSPASFSVADDGEGGSDYIFKVINRKGLGIYTKTDDFVVPQEAVVLLPDIYMFNLVSSKALDAVKVNLRMLDKGKEQLAKNVGNRLKTLSFNLDEKAMQDFRRLIMASQKSSDVTIVKVARGRVPAKVIDEDGRYVAEARIGLSGRTREHLDWFPSIDIKIKGGRSFNGMTAFKLYKLETKSGLYEFVFLSVLKDMGFFVPRQDVIRLVFNGEKVGLYLLMETPSAAMFNRQRELDGNIAGVDIEKLFFDYPLNGYLDPKYFFKLKGSDSKPVNKQLFLSGDFVKSLDPHSFAQYVAFSSAYFLGHGLGVDDLRFYQDPAINLFAAIPRDLNPGCWNVSDSFRAYLSHISWSANSPLYTIWPLKRLHRGDYSFDRGVDLFENIYNVPTATGVTDLHFSITSFLSDTKNLDLTNKYLYYFASDRALYEKINTRLINTLTNVLRQEEVFLLKKQLFSLLKDKIAFLGEPIRNNLTASGKYFSDGKDVFYWNIRTGLSLNPDLLPSFTAPLSEGISEQQYKEKLKLAFLCEKRIFSLLEENKINSPKKTFAPILHKDNKQDVLDLKSIYQNNPAVNQDGGNSQIVANVVTYLGENIVDSSAVLLFFLVRNATADAVDYKIKIKKAVSVCPPLLNTLFKINHDIKEEKASLRQIMLNYFLPGENLRLLVFRVDIEEKTKFYSMLMPKNCFFIFPPFMYLLAKSSGDSMDNAPLLPSVFKKTQYGYHLFDGSDLKINADLVIPAGSALFIHKGSTLSMSSGSTITVKGSLYILGSQQEPVKFISQNGQPWGGLLVQGGDRRRCKVVIKNAQFDNFGTWPKTKIGGNYLNGGLTFYRAEAELENVKVSDAKGEDGLNFISSNVRIDGLEISNAYSDGVDLDFSDMLINRFRAENIGGDALDLSSSVVRCSNSLFENVKDKGVSVGEMSNVLVIASRFVNNSMGIANKDQSFLKVNNCSFENNQVAIAEFVKKPYFGKPQLLAVENTYKENKKEYQWLGLYRY
ncbi:MAG: right-handed parallel beta-helix repeat-containing protein [Candidatus Omnitrophota bacterium]